MSTDEGELVQAVSLNLQGDIEGSCEVSTTRHTYMRVKDKKVLPRFILYVGKY